MPGFERFPAASTARTLPVSNSFIFGIGCQQMRFDGKMHPPDEENST
jgi:hypothetical protein